ncbi:hypothetical protein NEOLEDRAFT_808402 [Neolentinus lepideus HHB14362 ss-1]|uniref:Uncharacterized protein n=1 Tax=Neolentinus lepideus HHB14362 ss-1 TaxID=1314782 RepID=A0A165PGI4_9AGAM|nr:hypothetical protein NEOLEDRAFT_808402 [Neolentinus lepideus HHB14362 ss-1]
MPIPFQGTAAPDKIDGEDSTAARSCLSPRRVKLGRLTRLGNSKKSTGLSINGEWEGRLMLEFPYSLNHGTHQPGEFTHQSVTSSACHSNTHRSVAPSGAFNRNGGDPAIFGMKDSRSFRTMMLTLMNSNATLGIGVQNI